MEAKQMTLGEMIAELSKCDPTDRVCFAFGRLDVTRLDSYRGHYCELALGFAADARTQTVAELLNELRGAVGQVYAGYKAGEYRMDLSTPMWAANYGEAFQACIVGLTQSGGNVLIETASDEVAR